MRFIAFALLASIAALAARPAHAADVGSFASPPESNQPRIATVVTNRPFVRLGDLFPEAGDKADVAVAYSPAPGGRIVYDVNALASIARANGVKWQARSWFDRVVVERPAIVIGDAEVTAAVRAEMAKHNIDPKADIELATRGLNLQLPADTPPKLDLQSFQYDERSGQFSALLVVPAADGQQSYPISGRVYRTIEVPTLARRVNQGETVGRDDIQLVPMRAETLARNVIMDPAKIAGMEAKHALSSDQPLRSGDLRPPLVVTKGSFVTMVVQSPTMTLTAKGKALDSAALGDSVRIQNIQSKIIVEGEVVSPGTVRIASNQVRGF